MATKDMTNTGKVEKHFKLMRMCGLMVEAMMMGTLKVASSGEINQVLRRKQHGTQRSIHNKDGLRQPPLP
jgi:hypothetical protein